jgi:chemotaxis protein MotA
MDLATLIGFILATAAVLSAIFIGGSAGSMVNAPSMLIVVGGSIAVVLMRFSIAQFFGAIKVAAKAFMNKSTDVNVLITQVLDLADKARTNGVLALENVEVENKFLRQGIQHVVDGLDPDIIESILTKDMVMTVERHIKGQQIFKAFGDAAPAMGMIGTLIGLVQMLANLSDPSSLGPAMAVAMLTTLYGALLANIVAIPIADKLELRSQEEKVVNTMIIDAIMSIQAGQNPRILHDMLKSYLPSSKRVGDDASGGGEAESGGE